MSVSPFNLSSAATVQVGAAPEIVPNVLFSMWALTANDIAVEPWIAQAAALLSPEQQAFNRLLFAALGAALFPDATPADFAGYLDALETDAAAFQARLAAAAEQIDDPALQAAIAPLLADLPALAARSIGHLRTIWSSLLAAEWQRHTHLLTKMTRSVNELIFSQPQWQTADPIAALRFLLQTEPTDAQLARLAGVQRIVLVWSPHLLAHCAPVGDALWVVRKFEPQLLRRDPLRRAEVLGPLNTLADETRLRILELLIEQGELRAQEIIAQLEGSQGNVSRHLKQLVGAGFVSERRAGDANKLYTYEPAGWRRLAYLAGQLLSGQNARAVGQEAAAALQLSQARAVAPPALHDLVNEQGRITRWPGKLKEQEVMLRYLIEKFESERGYSEQQVNELLQAWYLDADFVLVRRSLIDAHLLARTNDGSRYWRA